jgi:hypothetical protein
MRQETSELIAIELGFFEETRFRNFAKHKNHENTSMFHEYFASFARAYFRDIRVLRKLRFFKVFYFGLESHVSQFAGI